MTVLLDWWQLGWALSGFLLLMLILYVVANRNFGKKMQTYGQEIGYRDRQMWELDRVVAGKLERQ